MRFGVNTWVWVSPVTIADVREIAPKIKAMGFDWIEIPIEGTDDLNYHEAAAVLRDHELGVSVCAVMGPDRDLILDDHAVQQNAIAYLHHTIDAVTTMGGANVVGPLYSSVGRVWQQTTEERARDMATLVPHLRALADYAADRGAVLCLEPLNRFETSFINLASQAIEVIDQVNRPACRIMLDTFHMNIEEKSLGEAIRLTGSRLAHLHACENDRGAPGTGNVNWTEVADALHDIDYDGPVVIESFTNKVKSIARAAAIWRPFESSQDALAQKGVRFLLDLLTKG